MSRAETPFASSSVRQIPLTGKALRLPAPAAWSAILLRFGVLLACIQLLALGAFLLAARSLPSAGDIAFTSTRSGSISIYRADINTGIQVLLTDDFAVNLSPAWSPDGEQIAFVSRFSNAEIYLMDANGGHVRRMTNSSEEKFGPTWSPDGRYIAFESYRDSTKMINILDTATGDVRLLTNRRSRFSLQPTWSPDSSRVAFYAEHSGGPELFVGDLTSGSIDRLTSNRDNDWNPVWSPDGRWLAFNGNNRSSLDIYVLNMDSGAVVQLTYHLSLDILPAWSPDNQRLAFISERSGQPRVYAMDITCLDLPEGCDDNGYVVGRQTATVEPVAWSPDSQRLAFVSDDEGSDEIYVADIGCAERGQDCTLRVTHNITGDSAPVWRP
jgi:Tol biopolymer transport system component